MTTRGLTSLLALFILLVTVSESKKLFSTTYDGFHWFMVFDTPILLSNESIDAAPYDLVWGASDRILPMYRATNPSIVLSFYIPWSRDNDGTHNLSYWNSFHPDWVLYQCDKVTPAYQFTDPHMPLDISNPDVIDWQVQRYTSLVAEFGYDGIAADNFAIGNALNACGIWKNGQWIQKYTGVWDDPAYNTDSLNWISTFYAKLKTTAPDVSFGINYSLNEMAPTDSRVMAVINHLDYVLDEAGFTGWGMVKPVPSRWDAISTWIENIQAQGKHYFGINEFTVLDDAAREWAMASYLMSKNAYSSMIATLVQGYGTETKMPQYTALDVGSPVGARVFKSGVWWRQYSNGLVLVNVYNDSVSLSLPNDGFTYKDVLGNTYSSAKPVVVKGQSGIVMGVTIRPPTTTLSATTTTTATTTTITTTTTTASATTSTAGSPITGLPLSTVGGFNIGASATGDVSTGEASTGEASTGGSQTTQSTSGFDEPNTSDANLHLVSVYTLVACAVICVMF